MKKALSISEIRTKYQLLRQATGINALTIAEVAKECGVKVTELMSFINENEYYFKLVEPSLKNGKTIPLRIGWVYDDVRLNPKHPEHFEFMKEKFRNDINVEWHSNYGYVPTDYPYIINLKGFINTEEKIQEIQKLVTFKEQTHYIGGYGDSSSHKYERCLSLEDLKILAEHGYKMNEVPKPGGHDVDKFDILSIS